MNWYDVIQPHEDIRNGEFDEAIFSADLGMVLEGEAPADYQDPETFFRKTYVTDNLGDLLQTVHERMTRGKGESVLKLQSSFGGGKTHSLVAVYHYLSGGEALQGALPDGMKVPEANVFAFEGTLPNLVEGRTNPNDDITRRTVWGEMAYQLGGPEGYQRIAGNDQKQSSPGTKDLKALLEPFQPFVLLFDEVVAYLTRARGISVGSSDLAAQTLSFFHELTGAVAGLPQGMLIATVPSKPSEDYDSPDNANLKTFDDIVDRKQNTHKPHGNTDDIYQIVRKRLFEEQVDDHRLNDVLDAYIELYRENANNFPSDVDDLTRMRRRMKLAYPFHPSVIDVLRNKWDSFPTFQRTRNVLALLANVVEDVYNLDTATDLILPGDVNLANDEIQGEFTEHIAEEHETVVQADIAGKDSNARQLDQSNPNFDKLAERNARTIFLNSFTADDAERARGATTGEVKFGVLRPGATPTLVNEVLDQQMKTFWYLQKRDGRYFFAEFPNVNRMVTQREQQIEEREVDREVRRRVEAQTGRRMKCYVWPEDVASLSDDTSLKLVILPPSSTYERATIREWIARREDTPRTYKNTLFFAEPNAGELNSLRQKARRYLAMKRVRRELRSGDQPSKREQLQELEDWIDDIDGQFSKLVRKTYGTVHHATKDTGTGELSVEEIDLGLPTVGDENLDTWYRRKLGQTAILEEPPSAVMLRHKLFSGEVSEMSTAELRDQFYKEPSLPALADDSVLREAIARVVKDGDFALVDKIEGEYDPESVQYEVSISPNGVAFSETTFLIEPDEIPPPHLESMVLDTLHHHEREGHVALEDLREVATDAIPDLEPARWAQTLAGLVERKQAGLARRNTNTSPENKDQTKTETWDHDSLVWDASTSPDRVLEMQEKHDAHLLTPDRARAVRSTDDQTLTILRETLKRSEGAADLATLYRDLSDTADASTDEADDIIAGRVESGRWGLARRDSRAPSKFSRDSLLVEEPLDTPPGSLGPGWTLLTPEAIDRHFGPRTHYALEASGLPAGKLQELYSGILRPLENQSDQDLTFSIQIEVHNDDGLDEDVLETQVRETLRQLGVEWEEE